MKEYQAFAKDYAYLESASMPKIISKTDCHKPCRYKEYVVLDGPLDAATTAYSYFSIALWVTSTDITILTEIPVYPWTSLMAEFGGTFSLFFGLSMMTLWDGMEKLVNVIKQFKAKVMWPA